MNIMIEHITLGTKETFYFDYNGEPLPLRPISSFELDECFYKGLAYADSEIAELVVNIKLGLISVKSKIDYDNKKLAELKKYFDSIDYWIVFYGMKDFQDIDFSKEIDNMPKGLEEIKKMQHIHKIASKILTYSYQKQEVIKEIIKTDEGKTIANIVFYLNVPLCEFGSLTKLQRDFLILSKLDSTTKKDISKSGDKMDIRTLVRDIV